jgi:hypothetical protein
VAQRWKIREPEEGFLVPPRQRAIPKAPKPIPINSNEPGSGTLHFNKAMTI